MVLIKATIKLKDCTIFYLVSTRSWTNGKLSRWYNRRINSWFKEQGVQLVCACLKQFEFIAAQRIRRSIQIFQLYARLWDEVALREFIKSWKQKTFHKAKKYLLGSIGVSAYNWDKERISDKEMQR